MGKKSEKTKELIKIKFIDLLSEKGLNDLTVKNITDELDINRGTFYLHYEDKYAVLEDIEIEIIEQIKKIFEEGTASFRGEGGVIAVDREKLLSILTSIYKYIKEVSNIIGILIGPKGDIAFQWKLKSLIENILQKNLQPLNLDDTMAYKYISVIASSAQLGILQNWIKGGLKESPEEVAVFMSNVINRVFINVLLEESKENNE